ncbi:hypothetical protein Hanom_Chr00s003317g01711541 [Helianthus anomalus]
MITEEFSRTWLGESSSTLNKCSYELKTQTECLELFTSKQVLPNSPPKSPRTVNDEIIPKDTPKTTILWQLHISRSSSTVNYGSTVIYGGHQGVTVRQA